KSYWERQKTRIPRSKGAPEEPFCGAGGSRAAASEARRDGNAELERRTASHTRWEEPHDKKAAPHRWQADGARGRRCRPSDKVRAEQPSARASARRWKALERGYEPPSTKHKRERWGAR